MTLVSVFAIGGCFALAVGLSTAFDQEENIRRMNEKPPDMDPALSPMTEKGARGNKNEARKEEEMPFPPGFGGGGSGGINRGN